MKTSLFPKIFIPLVLFLGCTRVEETVLTKEKMQFIASKFENALAVTNDPTRIPKTINQNGELKATGIYGWTSGFFAGNLWYMYELTGDEKWKDEARKWTEVLDPVKYVTNDHDVGFMINCSYGNGLKLTGNRQYEKVMIQAAKSLSTRYNPVVRSIKSQRWKYPTRC